MIEVMLLVFIVGYAWESHRTAERLDKIIELLSTRS
jgi:hypothetical protein